MPTAVALNAARAAVARLAGTAAGGFLFALAPLSPFLLDTLAHAVALTVLTLLRIPPREVAAASAWHLGREITTGLRWVWGQGHIRITALCAVVLNLFFSAFYLIVIVLAQGRGVPSGQIGVMAAMLGLGGLAGAAVAAHLSAAISPYVSIIAVFWLLAALTPMAALLSNGYLLGALLAAIAIPPALANTTITSGQLLLTSDQLRGRLSGVLGLVTTAAALGPGLGGLPISALTGPLAVLVCADGITITAVIATLSPTLRSFPRYPASTVQGH